MHTSDNSFSDHDDEQRAHLRMLKWMRDHSWSVSAYRDPAELYMLIEEHGYNLNNDDLNDNDDQE